MIGLEGDTTKLEVVAKHKGWCSLCRKRVYVGDRLYTWTEFPQYKVHASCIEVNDRMNAVYFQQNVRKNNRGKKAGTQWK
jgi:hypothetical protein